MKNPEDYICYSMDIMSRVCYCCIHIYLLWDWEVTISVLYSFRIAALRWNEHIPVPNFETISEKVSVIML